GAADGAGVAVGGGQGPARGPGEGAAAQDHHRRPGPAAAEPTRDAADGGGVQALPGEVRPAGDPDRDLPSGNKGAPDEGARTQEEVRGLPGKLQRRVSGTKHNPNRRSIP